RPLQNHGRRRYPGHPRSARSPGGRPGGPLMLALLGQGVLAATQSFKAPYFDYHALAPELILTGATLIVLVADLVLDETRKHLVNTIAAIGLLASFIPIV